MLTPFGITLRKLRLDHGMRLLDLAERLSQTSSFVSAVETGRKAIPADYVTQLARVMALSPKELDDLQRAADRTRTEVRVDGLHAEQRELVAEFARKVDSMPSDFLDWLKKPVYKSMSEEQPFMRRRKGLLVAPVSKAIIQQFCEQVRSLFVDQNEPQFPIMDVLEFRLERLFPGFYVESCSSSIMGADEGRVIAGQNYIMLREDVFDGACRGNRRGRFTACHELAHFLMHRQVVMARMREDDQPIYRDAEWQADEFAGRLLMSARHVRSFASADQAAAKCGMSVEAARVMMSKYQKEGRM